MRSLSHSKGKSSRTTAFVAVVFLSEAAWNFGCGSAGAPPPPLPPPAIVVTVMPANGSVVLGNQTTFMATLTNTADTVVSWSVNSVPGGNTTLGTITSAGLYTAPAELDAESGKRGTRRIASLSSHGNEQRASRYGDSLEPLGCGVRRRVRSGG